jgi:hypothetical protein
VKNKRLERGLEKISHIFLSDGNRAQDISQPPENQCEIQEAVTVCKKLSFCNHHNVQQHIQTSLAKHLEQGYQLKRICLYKRETVSEPKNNIHREEEVLISIK